MGWDETERCVVAEQPCRALVVVASDNAHDEPARHVTGGRPMAMFLAQLMVDTDPALRPARLERTRNAAALYARAAGAPAEKRRA